MFNVEWNEKGQRYLTPLQRDAFERTGTVSKVDGIVKVDGAGNVWFRSGEHSKLMGVATVGSAAERNLDAPEHATAPQGAPKKTPSKSTKRTRKPKK